MIATAAGHMIKPPLVGHTHANPGDVAGWAGDLMTFYLIEDVDGFLIAEKMRDNKPVTTALREHYEQAGGASRFQDFVSKRFDNTRGTAEDAAHYILTALDSPIINAGRVALEYEGGGPAIVLSHTLPDSVLQPYCLGFAETPFDRAGLEKSSRTKLLANHAKLFSGSAD